MSLSRLQTTVSIAMRKSTACTTGISCTMIEFKSRFPIPGRPKIFSMTTAPEISHGMDINTKVVTKIKALRSTCLIMTVFFGRPFA